MKVLALFVLLAVANAGILKPGKVCINNNDCVATYTPLCRPTRYDYSDPANIFVSQYNCVASDPSITAATNLMANTCPPGSFVARQDMVKDSNYDAATMGSCVPVDFPIGEICDPDVDASNVQMGKSDKVWCGYTNKWCADQDFNSTDILTRSGCASYLNPDSNAQTSLNNPNTNYIMWEGSCVNNKCYACAGSASSGAGDKQCNYAAYVGAGGTIQNAGTSNVNQDALGQTMISIAVFSIIIFLMQCVLLCRKKIGM